MPPRRQLTEDDRRRCKILATDGHFGAREISQRLGFTLSQVKYALTHDEKPRFSARGRRTNLDDEKGQALVRFVTANKKNRQMSYWELAAQSIVILGLAVGYPCIRSTLRRLGYRRYVARKKPHLDRKKKQERKKWAEEHLHWTIEQWLQFLWVDETWITAGGPNREQFVTRETDETYLNACLVESWPQKEGWMFWGCFSGTPISGNRKGPGLFWEKDWGTISEQSHRDHTAPVFHDWIQMVKNEHPDKRLVLMKDDDAAYSAQGLREDLAERGVELFHWPSSSPDLNPMEGIWCTMKDYVEEHSVHIEEPSYDMLRGWFLEAWDRVDNTRLYAAVLTMPQRCRDVIDAKGGSIKW